jgi:hypothetical protein
MKSGDQTDLEPLKAKKTDLGIVSDELCDFFTYLYGVVRLQKKSILNKLHNSGIEEPYISDIFTMYEADPSSQWHTIADKDYLTEFSIFLQHFFGSFDERMGLPGKGLKLTEEYPELHHFITTRKLKDDPKVRKLLSVLPTFDLLSKLYIVATDSNTLTVTTSKPSDDSSKYLNFAIFAIKYIQVVYNFIREKSESLLAKCKVSPPVAAPPKEEQKGGSDEIEFEEFTL